jgi:hypothetical protein
MARIVRSQQHLVGFKNKLCVTILTRQDFVPTKIRNSGIKKHLFYVFIWFMLFACCNLPSPSDDKKGTGIRSVILSG